MLLRTVKPFPVLVASFGTLAQISAAVVYESGSAGTVGGGFSADTSFFQSATATEFTIDAPITVCSGTVDGIYMPSWDVLPEDSFRISFFSDGGLQPSSPITPTIVVAITSKDVIGSTGSNAVYRVTFDLPNALELTAGTYWVSIVNHTWNTSSPNWAWAWVSNGSGSRKALSSSGIEGPYIQAGAATLRFTLNDTFSVPEPGALFLGAMSFIGLLRRKR